MIWMLLIIFIVICYEISTDAEHNALCYVGPDKFKEAKETMTGKEFKKFVKENSQKMKQAMNDAAAYDKLSPEEKQKIIDHTVKLHEERLKKELEQWRNK